MIEKLNERLRKVEEELVSIAKGLEGIEEIDAEFLDSLEAVEFAIENLNEELEY